MERDGRSNTPSFVELFDLQADPLEMENLAMGGKQHLLWSP